METTSPSDAGASATPGAPSLRHIAKIAFASLIGTAIEWYDFFIYGTAAALVFNKLFFPELSPVAGTLASYATFGVGFVARPLGGAIFGHFGDRLGRKTMLIASLLLMGTATTLVGVLPTYADIGVAAPILLVLLRFAQGIAVAGEWGGAVLMATEHAPKRLRGFFGSWPQMGVPIGLLLSTLTFRTLTGSLTPEQFNDWGWRVPFLMSIALLGVGMYIRLGVIESPAFTSMKEGKKEVSMPIVEVFRNHWRTVLLATGSLVSALSCFYLLMTFIVSYGTTQLGVARPVIFNGISMSAVTMLFALPFFAYISDRVGRKPVFFGGAIYLAFLAFPLFMLVETKDPSFIALALSLGQIGIAAMYGPQAALFSELFGTNIRYTGASVGYQLGSMIGGGFTPFIATALLSWSGGASWVISAYMIAMAIITVVSISVAQETNRTNLHEGQA